MRATGERSRTPVRAVLRFVASVMIVSGILLLGDAGATLAWQEPISAFLADREQGELADQLDEPEARAEVVKAFRDPDPVKREKLRGDAIGQIDLPTIGKRYYVVEGTGTDDLRKGPGHYPDTPLPGGKGTVGIAGHRTTHGAPFRKVDQLDKGDRIELEMPYGTFVYEVENVRVVEPTALWVTDDVGYKRLVLTACHPLYSAAQRIAVFAKQVGRKSATVRG